MGKKLILYSVVLLYSLFLLNCKKEEAEPLPIEIQNQVTHVSCFNGSDGAIDIFVSGGTPPYSYQWSNGKNSQDIDSLKAGHYSVIVTDLAGALKPDTFEVRQPLPDSLALTKITGNVSSYGKMDGKIDITITGGLAPYIFSWSNGSINEDLDSLDTGSYIVTVTDALDSTLTDTTFISQPEPEPLLLTLTGQDVSAYGKNDGTVISTVTGGAQPYGYEWSNGAVTPCLQNLGEGTYRLTVTDEIGTTVSGSYSVSEPAVDALILSLEVVHPTETGASDGQASAFVSGGYPPYTYAWSNNETTNAITGIPAGNYSVSVSDALGQVEQKQAVLTDSVYDYDGNGYAFKKIGNQIWMRQNLRVTHATDGTTLSCYVYNDQKSNAETYGRMYTWNVMMNGSLEEKTRGICPVGWHIPSDEEFKILEMELGMTREEADMVNTWRGKNVGTLLKTGGTSGYDAMLSGRRLPDGRYQYLDRIEYVWTSTFFEEEYAWRRCLDLYDPTVGRWNTFPKSYAFSVRCIKDE